LALPPRAHTVSPRCGAHGGHSREGGRHAAANRSCHRLSNDPAGSHRDRWTSPSQGSRPERSNRVQSIQPGHRKRRYLCRQPRRDQGPTRSPYPSPLKALGVRSGHPTAPSSSSPTCSSSTTTGSCCRSGQPPSTRTGQPFTCWSPRVPRSICSAMLGPRTPVGSFADSAAMRPVSSVSGPPTAVTPCGCRPTPTARGIFPATTHPTAHRSSSCGPSRGLGPRPYPAGCPVRGQC
jgi:hypothetical protein